MEVRTSARRCRELDRTAGVAIPQSTGVTMKYVVALLPIFVTAPIWYYLLFKLLQLTGATDVMWLLYWVYAPVGVFAQLLSKLIESQEGVKK
jgi:hypothetical protein